MKANEGEAIFDFGYYAAASGGGTTSFSSLFSVCCSISQERIRTKNLRFAKVELFPPGRLLQFGLSESVLFLVCLIELEARLQLTDQFLRVL